MGKCTQPGNHNNHICQLKLQQKLDEVKNLKVDAAFYCGNCDAPSRMEENLCDPRKYSGKPGILKWKK